MKNILLFIFLVIFSLIHTKIEAQAPNWLWAKALGFSNCNCPDDDDAGNDLVIDVDGNVYTTGYFTGTVDFDPGAGTFFLTATGIYDIFVLKMDSQGHFVWAKRMGGTFAAGANSIALDDSLNVYTTGWFYDTVDFDPDSSSTFNITIGPGYEGIFVSKLDSAGSFVWAKAMDGTAILAIGFSIATDASGNLYTFGVFDATVDFDPSGNTFNLSSAGNSDIFISKLDRSGNFIWAIKMGGSDSDYGEALTIDSSCNIYTTGYFYGTADFNPGGGTFNLTAVGTSDIFISKLDSAGNFLWAKQMGSTGMYDFGGAIGVDASSALYATGSFSDTVDFDPGAGIFNLISVGASDNYISKLDSAGNFVWAKSGVGGSSIVLDAFGNNYTAGSFISKSDSSGNFIWATNDGAGSTAIALDSSSNTYITGRFYTPSLTFGSFSMLNTDNSSNSSDIFIAKLDHIITSLESAEKIDRILIFPNPTNKSFSIKNIHANEISLMQIINTLGETVFSEKLFGRNEYMIQVNLDAGIYFVRVNSAEINVVSKLVVE